MLSRGSKSGCDLTIEFTLFNFLCFKGSIKIPFSSCRTFYQNEARCTNIHRKWVELRNGNRAVVFFCERMGTSPRRFLKKKLKGFSKPPHIIHQEIWQATTKQETKLKQIPGALQIPKSKVKTFKRLQETRILKKRINEKTVPRGSSLFQAFR